MDEHAMATNVSYLNVSNTSIATEIPHGSPTLDKVANIIITIALIDVMLGMGCSVEIKKLLAHFRRPIGPAIGMACQFVFLPLSMFGLAHALKLDQYSAIGLIVMAATPGGALSNMFAYWADGDVPLSLTMTILSNMLAFGMMPLNIWLYSRSWTNEKLSVPYKNIFISLTMTVGPSAVGMFFRWKWEKIAIRFVKISSIIGGMAVMTHTIIAFIRFPFLFRASWKAYFAGFALPAIGIVIGFAMSKILRQDSKYARTVAIETAMQNLPHCLAVISLSFPRQHMTKLLLFPIIAGVAQLCICFGLVIVYRLLKKYNGRKESNNHGTCEAVTDDVTKKEVEMELIAKRNENIEVNV